MPHLSRIFSELFTNFQADFCRFVRKTGVHILWTGGDSPLFFIRHPGEAREPSLFLHSAQRCPGAGGLYWVLHKMDPFLAALEYSSHPDEAVSSPRVFFHRFPPHFVLFSRNQLY